MIRSATIRTIKEICCVLCVVSLERRRIRLIIQLTELISAKNPRKYMEQLHRHLLWITTQKETKFSAYYSLIYNKMNVKRTEVKDPKFVN